MEFGEINFFQPGKIFYLYTSDGVIKNVTTRYSLKRERKRSTWIVF